MILHQMRCWMATGRADGDTPIHDRFSHGYQDAFEGEHWSGPFVRETVIELWSRTSGAHFDRLNLFRIDEITGRLQTAKLSKKNAVKELREIVQETV